MRHPPDDARPRRTWLDLLLLFAILLIATVISLPWILEARKTRNETEAIRSLRTIVTSQSVFREGDKEQDGNLDYGMLSELSNTALVDSVLGSGTKQGYLFEASYCLTLSEFLWFASAYPETPGETGDRYFVVDAGGVVFYTTGGVVPVYPGDSESLINGYAEDVYPQCPVVIPGRAVHGYRKLSGLCPIPAPARAR